MTKTENLLTSISEECAEGAQVACKALRFGLDHVWPEKNETNRRILEREIGEGMKYEDGKPGNEYCDNCDGCGWHEGGPTLQTKCEKCDGEGIIKAKSAERKGTA